MKHRACWYSNVVYFGVELSSGMPAHSPMRIDGSVDNRIALHVILQSLTPSNAIPLVMLLRPWAGTAARFLVGGVV